MTISTMDNRHSEFGFGCQMPRYDFIGLAERKPDGSLLRHDALS
jgi:hypothetical protein